MAKFYRTKSNGQFFGHPIRLIDCLLSGVEKNWRL